MKLSKARSLIAEYLRTLAGEEFFFNFLREDLGLPFTRKQANKHFYEQREAKK